MIQICHGMVSSMVIPNGEIPITVVHGPLQGGDHIVEGVNLRVRISVIKSPTGAMGQ